MLKLMGMKIFTFYAENFRLSKPVHAYFKFINPFPDMHAGIFESLPKFIVMKHTYPYYRQSLKIRPLIGMSPDMTEELRTGRKVSTQKEQKHSIQFEICPRIFGMRGVQ